MIADLAVLVACLAAIVATVKIVEVVIARTMKF